jgi:hypothetical protein
MIGRGCSFPLAEDESVSLLDNCVHRDNQAAFFVHSYPPPGRLGSRDDTHQVISWGLLAEHFRPKTRRRKSTFFHPLLARGSPIVSFEDSFSAKELYGQ